MNESEQKGMPIYLDPTARRLVAAGDDLDKDGFWYPSNAPARRLWACTEVLTDINDLLEDGMAAKNSGKRKRKAKLIAGQTHTLAKAINGLLSSIIGDSQIRKDLGSDDLKEVQEMQNDFAAFVPFQWGADLSTYRNKLVAHFDDAFWPKDATELLNAIPTNQIGQWLHICLHVLLDITKLKVFAWSCSSPHPGYVRFMHNEPFIVTIKLKPLLNSTRLTRRGFPT